MVLKLFGALDIVAAVVLVVLKFYPVGTVAWVFVGYLALKSVIFLKSLASIADFICAVFIALAALGHWYTISWIIVIWLVQKGILSFFGE